MKQNPLDSTWYFSPVNPQYQVNSVSISDDGSRCVFGSSFERGKGEFYTYLYDGTGTKLWDKPIADKESYQGVFWVDISGDGKYVASGGETEDTQSSDNVTKAEQKLPGYLQAFQSDTGTLLLKKKLHSRVNQVSLSQDGSYLAVCYGKTIEIFQLSENNNSYSYNSIFNFTSEIYSINSCMISRDGSTVVASGIQYSEDEQGNDTTSGIVYSYSVGGAAVAELGHCVFTTGSMRVAITDSASYWCASLHDGSCVLFQKSNPDHILWQCQPDNPDIMLAYAVAITETDSGDVYVACGANQNNEDFGGFLYFVKSERMVYEDIGYPAPYFEGVVLWSTQIKFGVNPGVSIDKNAKYVTATDGKPDGQTVQESAGSFYLFDALSGNPVWKHDTTMMNWPMKLARDGQSVIGGSDTGYVYYWKLNTESD